MHLVSTPMASTLMFGLRMSGTGPDRRQASERLERENSRRESKEAEETSAAPQDTGGAGKGGRGAGAPTEPDGAARGDLRASVCCVDSRTPQERADSNPLKTACQNTSREHIQSLLNPTPLKSWQLLWAPSLAGQGLEERTGEVREEGVERD